MPLPLLVFDGDCSVCRKQVENLRNVVGARMSAESFRQVDFFIRFPEFQREECERAIQLKMPNGRRFEGAEAVARTMALRWPLYPLMLLYYVPGLRWIWDGFYKWIARHRFTLSRRLHGSPH